MSTASHNLRLQPGMLPRAVASISRRMASTCVAAATSRVPLAARRPWQLSTATSVHGGLSTPATRQCPTTIGYPLRHATLSIATAATATRQPAASGIAPAAYTVMVDRLKDMAIQLEAQDKQRDPLSAKAQAEALRKLCHQLTEYLQTSGADLNPKQLVQHAGTVRNLHNCMGSAAFASSPAKDMLCALVDAAIKSPAMQGQGPGMLTSWSMLLHSLAPCHLSAPNMQQLLKTGMEWFRAQGPSKWTCRSGPDSVQPATVSLTLWAFATCGYKGDLQPLIAGINAAAEAHVLRGASAQEWCTTVWAAAKLGITTKAIEPVWRRAGPAITASIGKGRCNPQDISMAMYAAATCEAKAAYRPLTAGLRNMIALSRWDKQFHDASPQATATILLALSKMMPTLTSTDNPEWAVEAQLVAERCIKAQEKQLKKMIQPDSSLQTLITTILGMAGLRMFVSKLFTAALAAQLERIPSGSAQLLRDHSSHPSQGVAQDAAGSGQEAEPQSASTATEATDIADTHGDGIGASDDAVRHADIPQQLGSAPAKQEHSKEQKRGRAAKSVGSPAAWKAWTLDTVTVLFSCAQVYPGLAHGLQLLIAQQALQQQAAGHGKASGSGVQSAGSAQGEGQGDEEDDLRQGEAPADVAVLEQLHAQVQSWLRGTYSLMAKIETSQLADWDSQALSNFLWAWAALLPNTYQYSGLAVQSGSGSSTAVQGQDGQLSQDQAAAGSLQEEGTDGAAHPAILQLVAAVFQECARRGPTTFTEEGLTQIFTAHSEAKERNLRALGPVALDTSTDLIRAAQTLWREKVQARSNTNTSRSQQEAFTALSALGYKVELEALTPPSSDGLAPSDDPREGGRSGDGTVGMTGAGGKVLQVGDDPVDTRPSKPKSTLKSAATKGAATIEVAKGMQQGGQLSATAAGAVSTGCEPMRVDMLITALPDGTPCCIAVEFDGPSHFMIKPRHMYTGASALRHRQIQRRADGFVTVTSKEWASLNRGAKGAQKKERHKVYIQRKLEHVLPR